MIESVDFYPTITSLAGLEPEPGVEGVSRVPEIKNESFGVESAVCEWEFIPPQSRVQALRTSQYRLVMYNEAPNDGELYDCLSDPGELNNLFHQTECAGIVQELSGKLEMRCDQICRVHCWGDDAAAIDAVKEEATIRIHQGGEKWSDVKNQMNGVQSCVDAECVVH